MLKQKQLKEYTGSQLQQQIMDLAKLRGWRVAHFRPALTTKGWRTPVSGDGRGFPDLVLLRPPRIVVFECKSQYETVSTEQTEWIDDFMHCNGVMAGVVRPKDWHRIEIILQ